MPRDDLRALTTVIVRRAQLASLLLLGCVSLAIAADKVAELSDDFLEYLGSLEGDDESWLDFAAESAKPQTQLDSKMTNSKVASSASSSSASSLSSRQGAASANTSAASQTGKVEK